MDRRMGRGFPRMSADQIFYWLKLAPPSLPMRRVIRLSFFFRVLSFVSWLISPAHTKRGASSGRLGEPSGLKK